MTILRFLSPLAAALLVVGSAVAHAQDTSKVELRMQSTAPPGTPWANAVQAMVKSVEADTGGTVVIRPAPYGSEQDTILQLARGRVDMGSWSLNGAGLLVPELALLQLPFYFGGTEEQDCVLDALAPAITEMLAKKGVRFAGWNDAGVVHLIGKKAFRVPADLRGLKSGTFGSKAYALFWSAMDTSPKPVPTTEVSSAFQTGLIDVAANVTTVYVAAGIGKVAPVMTRVHVTPGPLLSLMNQQTWERLTPQQQSALDKARGAPAQARGSVRGFEQVLLQRHLQAGGQVVDISAEERARWRQAAAPQWPEAVRELGPAGEHFFQRMEAGRQACGKRS